jgi:hypothetical protein
VTHKATETFWKHYHLLPTAIQRLADKNFELLQRNPRHPSLQFKKVGDGWSVRVGIDYRALALQGEAGLIWVWIGPHDEYNKLLK